MTSHGCRLDELDVTLPAMNRFLALDEWITPARSRRGAVLRIRPLRPDDREREIAFINALSARSRYFRLFTPLKFLSRHLLDQLMDIDYRQRMAFVATTQQGGAEQFVGVARYGETAEPGIAELGVRVADAWQRSGIASLLIQQLIRYAQAQHLRRLIGSVLPDNFAMIALARRLAFTVRYDPGQHLFQISRDLGTPDRPLQEQARCTGDPLRGNAAALRGSPHT